MHQNLAVILWQFNNGKNNFIVLIPEKEVGARNLAQRKLCNDATIS